MPENQPTTPEAEWLAQVQRLRESIYHRTCGMHRYLADAEWRLATEDAAQLVQELTQLREQLSRVPANLPKEVRFCQTTEELSQKIPYQEKPKPAIAVPREAPLPAGELEDGSPMPFGKHQGAEMADVPADYLHYLWIGCESTGGVGLRQKLQLNNNSGKVARYIHRYLGALKQECRDKIWS